VAATAFEERSEPSVAPVATEPVSVVADTESVDPVQVTSVEEDEANTVTTHATADFVVVESGLATSHTNLQPAPVTSIENELMHPVPAIARLATEPNHVLQMVYLLIGIITVLALFASVMIEWREHRPVQTVYGLLLLFVMCGLFALHITLTGHVLIV
jgi:hypothetical protein